jgi:hypothetical protein
MNYLSGKPWTGNIVALPAEPAPLASKAGRVHLAVTCGHSGFRGTLPLTLRPNGEAPGDQQRTLAWSLNNRRG